jgi:hypothetical protein
MSLWRRVYQERRRVVLPLAVALVANVAALALVVLPLKRAVVGAQEASLAAAMNLASARSEDMHAKAARTSMERGDLELKKFYAEILPPDYSGTIDVLNYYLCDAAEEVRLACRSGEYDREDVRDSSLTKVTGRITLTGDYGNIRQFLYNLETAKEFVVIERVELSQANTVKATTALEVSLSVATYYLREPQVRTAAK